MQFNYDRNRLASIFSVLLISTLIHIIGDVGGGGGAPVCYDELLDWINVRLKTNPKPLSQQGHISNGRRADSICFLTSNSWWGSWWPTQTVFNYGSRMGVSICCSPPPPRPHPCLQLVELVCVLVPQSEQNTHQFPHWASTAALSPNQQPGDHLTGCWVLHHGCCSNTNICQGGWSFFKLRVFSILGVAGLHHHKAWLITPISLTFGGSSSSSSSPLADSLERLRGRGCVWALFTWGTTQDLRLSWIFTV